MRRVLGLTAVLVTLVVLTGCHVRVPGVRQAANPCTLLGQRRLAHLAHARGAVTQKPLLFSQAQTCEFKAARGVPVIVLGTFDGEHLDFGSEVSKTAGRFHAVGVHRVAVRGADQAAAMRAVFNGVQVPVLMSSHDGFISLVLVISRSEPRSAALARATMTALVRASR